MQVKAVRQGHTIVTTEADSYNIGSMATPAAHTPLRLRTGDVPVCVCERGSRGVWEQRLLIDLFFWLFIWIGMKGETMGFLMMPRGTCALLPPWQGFHRRNWATFNLSAYSQPGPSATHTFNVKLTLSLFICFYLPGPGPCMRHFSGWGLGHFGRGCAQAEARDSQLKPRNGQ